MTPVQFEVRHQFDAPPRVVWDELVDWKAHEAWIPATRVEVEPGDSTAVGATFTAFTGYGPLALEDRMRVTTLAWDDATSSGECEVEKLGPVLRGRAGFTITPHRDGAEMVWLEDVTVPYAPRFVAPVIARVGAAGFRFGIRRLAKQLTER